ncbi:hypothetical protein QBC32DRAFT_341708 [Pseudoneurospora amorphoporcata]|uniref:Uncharacterized protein n=1 Tax=Pseudoneurospora amorphoporcata TaxID=241081 RepID=A0AAN6SG12_9PEZI|nr:hypothetical protein QBC32DRAFT_341708 [Pseudoneurospora amorphoporcata]
MICLVYLENIKGQFINHVASAQEIANQRQITKSVMEEVTNKLEHMQEVLEHSSKNTMEQIKEQINKHMMLTSEDMAEKLELTSKQTKKMSEQAKQEIKKMTENATKTIDSSSDDLREQICSLEYTTDDIDKKIRRSVDMMEQCQEVLTQAKHVKETMDQAKEVVVLTMEELKLAKEDMQRERLLFQNQHDRLEQKINEMARHMEGRDAENKGLKALYSKLTSHALRSVQNATNFRDAQYKFLVDGFARFEQKMAFITHHIGNTSAISGTASNAVTTANDTSKAADKTTSKSPKPKTEEEKIAELQKTINNLKYERDVLTGNNKLLELRLAKFEQETQAQAALAAQASPVLGPEPDTPCPNSKTLKSHKSKRSLTTLTETAGEPLPQLSLTLSDSNSNSKDSLATTVVGDLRPSASVSVESLILPDLWERLLAPSLLSDEHKRRLRLIKPQVTGGLRLETLFLRVVNIVVHDTCWDKFDEFLKEGSISQWYCVHGVISHGWCSRDSAILVDHSCEGKERMGKGGECLRVMRTGLDYGKIVFRHYTA